MIDSSSAIAKAMSSTNRLQEMMGANSAIVKAMSSTNRLQEMMGANSAIVKAMGSTNRLQEMIDSSSAIAKAMSSTNRLQEMMGANSAMSESVLTSSIFSQSLITLAEPENFTSAISVVDQELSRQDFVSLITENDASEEIVNVSLDVICNDEGSESFATLFSRIPFPMQIILIFMIMQIILPQINSISANLITPHVNEFISDISDENKVRALKKYDFKKLDVPLKNLRFISSNNVRLRSDSNLKSEVVDLLRLGQVVVFLEKKKNWTNIMVQYENKEVVSGWVFTRYVEKFRT